jgi:hypothetical protein
MFVPYMRSSASVRAYETGVLISADEVPIFLFTFF